jgi:hypothetical protein
VELRHLRYFVAIGEEQHYGRATHSLRVAQPALSRQIQDLEEEIGFKLFEHLPRGVKLSAAGKLFLEDVRRILKDVDEAARRAGRVALGRSGTLRVGFTETGRASFRNRSGGSGSCNPTRTAGSVTSLEWKPAPVRVGPSGTVPLFNTGQSGRKSMYMSDRSSPPDIVLLLPCLIEAVWRRSTCSAVITLPSVHSTHSRIAAHILPSM